MYCPFDMAHVGRGRLIRRIQANYGSRAKSIQNDPHSPNSESSISARRCNSANTKRLPTPCFTNTRAHNAGPADAERIAEVSCVSIFQNVECPPYTRAERAGQIIQNVPHLPLLLLKRRSPNRLLPGILRARPGPQSLRPIPLQRIELEQIALSSSAIVH
jgi:hypothetical protein